MTAKARATPPPAIEDVEHGWYLKPLSSNPARQQWPHRLVVWDCEGLPDPDGGPHAFACAHARLYLREGTPGQHEYSEAEQALRVTAAGFWDLIHSWTRRKESMRLFAQHHVYDLGVSAWWEHLGQRLGYTGQPGRDFIWAPSGEVPYLRVRLGDRSPLTFTDTDGLFGCSVAQLARDLELGDQPPLEDLHRRAAWDTEVTAAAVLRYLERLRQLGCSPRGMTGASHGFAVLRTLHLDGRGYAIEHHGDAQLWQVEEASRYGGRREGWRHGRVDEPCEEWDYQHAHASICLQPVPTRCFHADATPMASVMDSSRWVDLQEWIATTDVPCLPYRDPRRGVLYPTGRFPVTLWAPEAAMALRYGVKLEPGGRRWRYERTAALAPWAEWIVQQLDDPDPLWHRVCKRWSHTTTGRFGQANGGYEPAPPGTYLVDPPGLRDGSAFCVNGCHGHPHGYSRMLYTPVGAYGIHDAQVPADHANYAIQSWIMSQARIKLWEAMQVAGLDEVVQVNTDGLVVTQRGADRLEAHQPYGLRPKHEYRRGVEIRNAQAVLDLDSHSPHHKISGLPRKAHRLGPDTWAAEVWHEGLLTAPVTRDGVWTLPPGPLGRARRPDGVTAPYRVAR